MVQSLLLFLVVVILVVMPQSSKSSKVYAVAVGRTTGIFSSWAECQSQVHGFARAQFQSFRTRDQAETYMRQHGAAGAVAGSASRTIRNPTMSTARSTTPLGTKRQRESRKVEERIPSFPSVVSAATVHHKRPRRQESHHNEDLAGDSNNNNINNQNTVGGGWHLAITFDGGSRGNPGLAGAGATVTLRRSSATNSKQPTTTVLHIRDFVGTTATNNEAEYQGLVVALRVAQHEWERQQQRGNPAPSQQQWRLTGVTVQGDSQLIIQQLKGTYQCRSDKLKSRYRQAKELLEQLRQAHHPHNNVPVSLEHVYRSDNQVADGT